MTWSLELQKMAQCLVTRTLGPHWERLDSCGMRICIVPNNGKDDQKDIYSVHLLYLGQIIRVRASFCWVTFVFCLPGSGSVSPKQIRIQKKSPPTMQIRIQEAKLHQQIN